MTELQAKEKVLVILKGILNSTGIVYYIVNTMLLVFIPWLVLKWYFNLEQMGEVVFLLLILVVLKILADIFLSFQKLTDKLYKTAAISLIATLVLVYPFMVAYAQSQLISTFKFSPESVLGKESVHVELIEDNIYAAYWQNGVEYGVAILRNDFGDLRWKTLRGGYTHRALIGDPYWIASTSASTNKKLYYAVYFKTYEPQIKGIILEYEETLLTDTYEYIRHTYEIEKLVNSKTNLFTGFVNIIEEDDFAIQGIYLKRVYGEGGKDLTKGHDITFSVLGGYQK